MHAASRAAQELTLWIMRHSETEWNAAGLLQGHGDSPLTDRGREQARQAARLLESEGIDRIVTSDLGRALATARIVADLLGIPVARTDQAWRELAMGIAEGQPKSAITELPGYERRPDWTFPEGESLALMRDRVLRALAAVVAEGEPTLVVSHAGPIRVLLAEAAGLGARGILEVPLPKAFVGRMTVQDDAIREVVVLRE